ncbi:N-acetylmuramoyl-L-alanine amidase [Simiduia sp. 21SJ11W-1]|uniref:N-acetylmuramoyl-L-alanine amidase n=1 Tax=Simiduia sp. 21SJ11W-1 TaxID=2909669 RepID=UPI00209F7587|nr:N-acetylmuramoyl-L-alanine amidase [Simiduia sp. 21SJ11W-1]UTA48399.1 N-acetylmuramoyl-L-alanine amidase [Simiduia sp. 21SJ11W-1]
MLQVRKVLLPLLCAGLTACASGPSKEYVTETVESANTNERVRFLVMHFTAINFERSLRALTQPSSRPVSSHYLVPENNDPTYPHDELKVFQLVEEHNRAWHAGPSRWEDREQLNDQSIGIEIVNLASCHRPKVDLEQLPQTAATSDAANLPPLPKSQCLFPDFDPEQIQLVIKLSKDILARYPEITPTRVVGHGDIIPYFKNDPGPRFPWQQLAKAGVGAWYDDDTVRHYTDLLSTRAYVAALNPSAETAQFTEAHTRKPGKFRAQTATIAPDPSQPEPQPLTPEQTQVAEWLAAYGYGIVPETATDLDYALYVKAFQYHFRPWQVDGEADIQTQAILLALLAKYFPKKVPLEYGLPTPPATQEGAGA